MAVDNVNHPSHYCNNKAGIEVIEVTANLCFDLGNAFKYLARYKSKKLPAEDVKKAVFYLNHFREHLNAMHTYVICSEEEIPALVKKMWKFCEVEDVQCIRRAMETITQAVIAEEDHIKPVKLPLLTEEQWKITIQALQNYAESIADKKPEDFNG
jgi:hypothetical protein